MSSYQESSRPLLQNPLLQRVVSFFKEMLGPESKRGVTFSSVNVENGLHQAVALAAMTLLVTAHRAIMNTGFTLQRRGLSTDAIISFTVGLITLTWTTLVIMSGLFIGQRPCRAGLESCLSRLSYAPWLMQVLFFFWILAFLHELLYVRAKGRALEEIPSKDEESRKPKAIQPYLDRLICSERLKIWRMKASRGALDWAGSVDWKFRWTLYSTMIVIVMVTSYGAIRAKLYTVGMLNLVGLVLFILGAGGANKYTTAPHMYAADMLRVILDTRHKEGTVYILPSREHGFDAVWSPKIDYEYRESDEGSPLSSNPHDVKPRKRGELKRLDRRLAAFSSVSELKTEEVNCLATWLYQPESAPAAMRNIDCIRAPGINLMAPSVMLSLYHAEYLIFMQRHRLEPHLLKLSGSFRQVKGSGMDIDNGGRQIGKLPGLQGYQEAVRHLYSLFNEPIDSNALLPTSAPPKTCELFPVCPDSIEGYVAALWDHCIVSEESTIAALYAFTMFSDFDIGNDVANGRHGFPLRSRDREGDLVSWHVIWRQAWYAAVIAQLTSMSPIILSAFVAGILQ